MLLSSLSQSLNGIGYTSAPAPVASKKEGLSRQGARFVKTPPCHRRLARRAESARFRTGHCLSKLRSSRGFKIIRQHVLKRLGQSRLMGKVGLGSRSLVQIQQARKLEASLNKFEFGSRMDLRPEGASILSPNGVLARLLKKMDRAAATVGNHDTYHQVNLLRAQQVGGTALRDLCVNATSKKTQIASLEIVDSEFETAKVRGLGYALLAINGNPDLESSKVNRPDLLASGDNLMSRIGGQDLALESLNRIARARPLDPRRVVTVTPQELEALRTGMANKTVSYRWLDSLVNTSRDLQAVLDIALE